MTDVFRHIYEDTPSCDFFLINVTGDGILSDKDCRKPEFYCMLMKDDDIPKEWEITFSNGNTGVCRHVDGPIKIPESFLTIVNCKEYSPEGFRVDGISLLSGKSGGFWTGILAGYMEILKVMPEEFCIRSGRTGRYAGYRSEIYQVLGALKTFFETVLKDENHYVVCLGV